MKILILNDQEQALLLRLVRNKLDETYPRPHSGTIRVIEDLTKLKEKLS